MTSAIFEATRQPELRPGYKPTLNADELAWLKATKIDKRRDSRRNSK